VEEYWQHLYFKVGEKQYVIEEQDIIIPVLHTVEFFPLLIIA